jgi:predicted DCC family thiol-disulfide oxidoreductase YuxK
MEDARSDSEESQESDRSPADIVDGIDRPVLLFDGVCNLCHGAVRLIVSLDGEGRILFAPLRSPVGQELLGRHGLGSDYFDSLVFVEGGQAYTKSTAVLRACRYLDGPVPLAYPFVSLPERLRDWLYDLVAEYRYDVFGRKEECPVPPEHVRERFLERSLA